VRRLDCWALSLIGYRKLLTSDFVGFCDFFQFRLLVPFKPALKQICDDILGLYFYIINTIFDGKKYHGFVILLKSSRSSAHYRFFCRQQSKPV
jgi:hypothetical protein